MIDWNSKTGSLFSSEYSSLIVTNERLELKKDCNAVSKSEYPCTS